MEVRYTPYGNCGTYPHVKHLEVRDKPGMIMESVATKLLWLNSYKSTVEIYEINIIFVRVTLRFKKYMWLLNLSALNRHPPICKVSNLERSFMRDASMYKYLCVCRWNT